MYKLRITLVSALVLLHAGLASALPAGGFLPNQGQWDSAILAAGTVGDARVIALAKGLLLDFPAGDGRQAVAVVLPALGSVQLVEPTGATVNSYRGADPARWAEGLRLHGALRYADPSGSGQVEFRLAPAGLRYAIDGVVTLDLEASPLLNEVSADGRTGRLRWPAAAGDAPRARDAADQLLWSTLFGGDDYENIVAVRETADGSLVLIGETYSTDLPTAAGAYDASHNGEADLFFAQMSATGDSLHWCTYLGGSTRDHIDDAVLAEDALFFTSTVMSSDLPVPGALDDSFGGYFDIYLGRLGADGGTLDWASYLGGTGDDQTSAILVNSVGNPIIAGHSGSASYPSTPGAFQETPGGDEDIVVTCLAGDGSAILWSTFLGGTREDYAADMVFAADGDLLIGGSSHSANFPVSPGAYDTANPSGYNQGEAVVVRLAPDGSARRWASFLGGNTDGSETAYAVAEDPLGNVVVAGRTAAANFPTTPGAFDRTWGGNGNPDVFVTKFNPQGTGLIWSTFIGGEEFDYCIGMELLPEGHIVLVGATASADFPATPGAYDETINSSPEDGADCFVSLLSAGGDALFWSTFLGGGGDDRGSSLTRTGDGGLIASGTTWSSDFPTTPGAYMETSADGSAAFLAKFTLEGTLTAVETAPGAPASSLRAHPNPFNPHTRLTVSLARPGALTLSVHDASGRLVTLVAQGDYPAGEQVFDWDGRDAQGVKLPSGLYLARLGMADGVVASKLLLLK